MKIFFTSDTHFGSKRTLELSKRPFENINEMDSQIIDNWNSLVTEEDMVFHLGDFGDYTKVKELNGKIVLIYGNYEFNDNIDEKYLIDLGFHKVFKNNIYSENINGLLINMAHIPSHICKTLGDNEFNLFGHIHKLQMVKKHGLNVGVDCHNFYPIDFETVLFYKNAIINFYDDEVFN